MSLCFRIFFKDIFLVVSQMLFEISSFNQKQYDKQEKEGCEVFSFFENRYIVKLNVCFLRNMVKYSKITYVVENYTLNILNS